MKVLVRTRRGGLCGLSHAFERNEALDDALRTGVHAVATEAREGLERDGGPGTRALANSLDIQRGPRPLSYRLVSLAPRAWFREFGSLSCARQPWLRPALDRVRSGVVRGIAQAVRRIVTRR